jgi:hypothetical protein
MTTHRPPRPVGRISAAPSGIWSISAAPSGNRWISAAPSGLRRSTARPGSQDVGRISRRRHPPVTPLAALAAHCHKQTQVTGRPSGRCRMALRLSGLRRSTARSGSQDVGRISRRRHPPVTPLAALAAHCHKQTQVTGRPSVRCRMALRLSGLRRSTARSGSQDVGRISRRRHPPVNPLAALAADCHKQTQVTGRPSGRCRMALRLSGLRRSTARSGSQDVGRISRRRHPPVKPLAALAAHCHKQTQVTGRPSGRYRMALRLSGLRRSTARSGSQDVGRISRRRHPPVTPLAALAADCHKQTQVTGRPSGRCRMALCLSGLRGARAPKAGH